MQNPHESTTPVKAIRVAGVVLASGMSQRFGAENKLVAPVEGIPLVRRAVEAYIAGDLQPVFVILGYEAEIVGSALTGLPVTVLVNPDFAEGQSRALSCGVRALPDGVRAAVIGVADQPYLTGHVICQLVERYRLGGVKAVVPHYGNEQGGPVLFDRSLFAELLKIEGDNGGRSVVQRYGDAVARVHVADEAAGVDIDTADEYDLLTSKHFLENG